MSKEIRPLTGVRAFAAWGVFFYHFSPGMKTLFPALTVLDPLAGQGDKGVDLFFVLSGFILAYNYAGRMAAFSLAESRGFLLLRIARVYPVHVFAQAIWAGFLVVNLFVHHMPMPPGSYRAGAFVANLLLVQAWSVPIHLSWNYPAWSVSMEWFAYLQFPFLVLALPRLRSRSLVLAGICLISLSAPMLSEQPYFHFVRIESEFLVGMLLYWLYQREFAKRVNWGIVAILASAAAVVLVSRITWFVFPVFVVLIYSLAMGQGLLCRFLASAIANYWGRASYSLYMMHAAVISVLHVLLPPARYSHSGLAVRTAVLLAYPAAVALVAAATLHWVEEPGRHAIRSLASRLRRRPLPAALDVDSGDSAREVSEPAVADAAPR